jgi:DNA-binding CsgD family transcriptional regulator
VAPDVASQTLRDFVGTRAGVALKPRPLLTAREQQTMRLLGEGLTDKQIAERLFVSPRTVQNHLARIREKTGLGRRSALGRWAGEHISD